MKKIIRFGLTDTMKTNKIYVGYWSVYYLCDSVNHYKVREPRGVLSSTENLQIFKTGKCDGECIKENIVMDPDDLPEEVQESLGIVTLVPEGKIFISPKIPYGFEVMRPGDKITPKKAKKGKYLSEGESIVCLEVIDHSGIQLCLVRNRNGKVFVDNSREIYNQFNYLLNLGFSQEDVLQIMETVRPNQTEEIVKWLEKAIIINVNHDNISFIMSILTTILLGGKDNFKDEKVKHILKKAKLPIPSCGNYEFFNGAETILSSSCRF